MLAIFLDIETTGLDPTRHRAIDIALKAIDVNLKIEIGSYQSLIKPTAEVWDRRDPHSIEINGYTYDMLTLGKDIFQVRQEILDLFKKLGVERGKAVFICQNPSFDRSFFTHIVDVYTQEKLNWPYHWLDFASMYWALLTKNLAGQSKPFPQAINLSKNEIGKQYKILPESEPHRAMNGVDHLIECYKTVVGFA